MQQGLCSNYKQIISCNAQRWDSETFPDLVRHSIYTIIQDNIISFYFETMAQWKKQK